MQIYESVMVGPDGAVTTGLLTALRYVKDNRLLPHGFDKRTADKDVAVHGDAEGDADFTGGGDRIRYSVGPGRRAGAVPGGRRAVVSADRLSLGDESQEVRRDGAADVSSATTRRWRRVPV